MGLLPCVDLCLKTKTNQHEANKIRPEKITTNNNHESTFCTSNVQTRLDVVLAKDHNTNTNTVSKQAQQYKYKQLCNTSKPTSTTTSKPCSSNSVNINFNFSTKCE